MGSGHIGSPVVCPDNKEREPEKVRQDKRVLASGDDATPVSRLRLTSSFGIVSYCH